jgi:hypothetical protein
LAKVGHFRCWFVLRATAPPLCRRPPEQRHLLMLGSAGLSAALRAELGAASMLRYSGGRIGNSWVLTIRELPLVSVKTSLPSRSIRG